MFISYLSGKKPIVESCFLFPRDYILEREDKTCSPENKEKIESNVLNGDNHNAVRIYEHQPMCTLSKSLNLQMSKTCKEAKCLKERPRRNIHSTKVDFSTQTLINSLREFHKHN